MQTERLQFPAPSEKYMRDNKIKQVVTNRLYSFLNQWSWREMFKDVIDPEEKNQRKMDAIAVRVTVGGGKY